MQDMSQKTTRKLRRRSNEDTDLKLMKNDPGQSEEVVEQIGDSTDDSDLKGFSMDGTDSNAFNGAESSHIESLAVETASQINIESETITGKQDETETAVGESKKKLEKQENEIEEKENKEEKEKENKNKNKAEENENTLEQKEESKEEEKNSEKLPDLNNADQHDDDENQEELDKLTLVEEDVEEKAENVESKNGKSEATLEPLENEEPDPELQFDENSDADSRKGSPVIRCKTRRSLTRNIPTPKTPKSLLDVNGDEKNSEYSDKQSIITVPTPEITDTESEVSSFRPVTDIETKAFASRSVNADDFMNNIDETLSISNISTKAVVGSELTQDDLEDDCSSFLDMTKDKSVGETLRNLSSRRSIRPAKDYQKLTYQLNNQRQYNNLHFQARQSMERVSGLKRKNRSHTPDNTKRFKTEPTGFMSYISSPIASFRYLFAKSDLPSSTPKLTGYKNKSVFENPGNSKMNLDMTPAAEDISEKKGGCVLM